MRTEFENSPEIYKTKKKEKSVILSIEFAQELNEKCLGYLPDYYRTGDLKMNSAKLALYSKDETFNVWPNTVKSLTPEQKKQTNNTILFAAREYPIIGDIRIATINDVISKSGLSEARAIFLKEAFAPRKI